MPSRSLSVTHALIGLCVAVFVIGLFLQAPAIFSVPIPADYNHTVGAPNAPLPEIYGSFSYFSAVMQGEWWRFLTYQFVHANLGHLVFNMWALYFFGPAVERVFGAKKFLLFYLLCGISGAVFSTALAQYDIYSTLASAPAAAPLCNMLAQLSGYEAPVSPWMMVPLVGASASIYGVLIATAFLYPDVCVQLLFPPVVLKLRTFALGVIAFAVFIVFFNLSNAGGEAGHLGGIIMGTLIMLIYRLTHPRGE